MNLLIQSMVTIMSHAQWYMISLAFCHESVKAYFLPNSLTLTVQQILVFLHNWFGKDSLHSLPTQMSKKMVKEKPDVE